MSCRCPKCDWPIRTKQVVRIKCIRCEADIVCGEGPLPEEKPPQPIPRDQWPVWAGIAATRKCEGDTGVGDTVKRYADQVGGEKFKAWSASLGIPCGCVARQKRWNVMYPYEKS